MCVCVRVQCLTRRAWCRSWSTPRTRTSSPWPSAPSAPASPPPYSRRSSTGRPPSIPPRPPSLAPRPPSLPPRPPSLLPRPPSLPPPPRSLPLASPPVPPASPLPPNLRQFHCLRLRAPPPLPSFRFTLLGACAQAWPVPAECSTPALIFLVQPRPPRPPSCPPGVPPVCRAPPRVMAGLGSACRRVSGPRHAHASARRGVCGGVGAAASGAASR